MTHRTKTYFASDLHLGSPYHDDPREAERRFVRWLHSIEADAKRLILVGDIFDYWYEYRYVALRGFTRTIGLLGEMSDAGVEIHFLTGNHDIWIRDYLPTEIGCTVHREAIRLEMEGRSFHIAHGDEYADGLAYAVTRRIFHSPVCQALYSLLPTRFTVPLAQGWAQASRKQGLERAERTPQRSIDEEYLVRFARQDAEARGPMAPDYYIFGHRHLLADLPAGRESRVILLGDWIRHLSYAVWDGERLTLETFHA